METKCLVLSPEQDLRHLLAAPENQEWEYKGCKLAIIITLARETPDPPPATTSVGTTARQSPPPATTSVGTTARQSPPPPAEPLRQLQEYPPELVSWAKDPPPAEEDPRLSAIRRVVSRKGSSDCQALLETIQKIVVCVPAQADIIADQYCNSPPPAEPKSPLEDPRGWANACERASKGNFGDIVVGEDSRDI